MDATNRMAGGMMLNVDTITTIQSIFHFITDVVLCFFFTLIFYWLIFQKRLQKLQRALWLARAKTAFAEYFFWNHIAFVKTYAKCTFTISHSNTTNNKSNKVSRTPREWADIWYDVEFKCRAYADKFKEV